MPVGKSRQELVWLGRGQQNLHRPTMVALTVDEEFLITEYSTEFSSAIHREKSAIRWQEPVRLGRGMLWN